jgi:hypothetical protein
VSRGCVGSAGDERSDEGEFVWWIRFDGVLLENDGFI